MKKGEFYTREEVYAETIKYFNGDDLAATVWIDKYCLKEKNGEDLEDSPIPMEESSIWMKRRLN